MALLLAVCAAGGLGALTRSAVNAAIMGRFRGGFELGTFVINVSGAGLLGLVTGAVGSRVGGGAEALDFATIFGTGFLGAFTTFSSEEWQALVTRRSRPLLAARDVGGTLAASLIIAGLGLWLGTQL